ncbi:hypothetical protein KAS79_02895 [Candidatus Parcubacteria bacterium]|nr:hypothetical protein [Candidatus Parcubacteria bacterium]
MDLIIRKENWEENKCQGKSKFFLKIIFLMFALMIAAGMTTFEESSSANVVLNGSIEGNILEKEITHRSAFAIDKSGIDRYFAETLLYGHIFLARMEQSYFCARAILKTEKFSDIDDISEFLNRENFGCCRNRAPIAYWFLKSLYPDEEIKLVVGYLYCPEENYSWNWTRGLLSVNHAWLERENGEIVDVSYSSNKKCYYHPYVYVFYELTKEDQINEKWVNKGSVATSAVRKQFEYDHGMIDEVDLTVPWGNHELNKKISRSNSSVFLLVGVAKQVFLF